MDMKFPLWIRLLVAVSAIMQLGFGITLMADPARIADVWPWTMPPLTARVLGASTLVSVPLALLSVGINRYALAAIPFVMMGTYRVLQLAAGLVHADRFGANLPMTVNYFGGGFLMLVVFAYGLWAGQRKLLPPAPPAAALPWNIPGFARTALAALGVIYVALGVMFFAAPGDAASYWVDARGMTPLTARLFSSPMIGLGLGLFLVSRARDWRAVAIPATGMVTIGAVVMLAFALGRADFAPRTTLAWLVAASPLVLFAAGAAILLARPRTARAAASTHA
jgi:hypothetical protein